jgi:thioester reductase-like protein
MSTSQRPPVGRRDGRPELSDTKRRLLDTWRKGRGPARVEAIGRRSGCAPVELSYAQQRLWFLTQMAPDSPFYNMIAPVRLTGPLDVDVLARALNRIVARHEALRTVFRVQDGSPRQLVTATLEVPLTRHRVPAGSEPDTHLEQWLRERSRALFDLEAGPLVRFDLLRLAEHESVLVVAMHHTVGDGLAIGVLFRELKALYEAFATGAADPLPEPAIQYADFSVWQREWLSGARLDEQLDYWRARLGFGTVPLRLPTDRERPAVPSYRGVGHGFALSPGASDTLRALGRKHDATVYMTLLAAFQAFLYRLTGQTDIATGSADHGRHRPELEGLIGFFANTLVLRTDLTGDPTFEELLGRVKATCLGAYRHKDVPFEMLVAELAPERETAANPLFQAMFVMQSPSRPNRFGDVEVTSVAAGASTSQFDLVLHCWEDGDTIEGTLRAGADLFDLATVERFAGYLERLLIEIADAPDRPLTVLPLLDEAGLVAVEHAGTGLPARPEAAHRCPVAAVRERARSTPEAVAVRIDDTATSYAHLAALTDTIACALRARGVVPGSRVGIAMSRSPERIATVLGTLAAGAVCVPCDPADPPAWRERVRAATAPALLVVDDESLPGALSWADLVLGASRSPGATSLPAPAGPAWVSVHDVRPHTHDHQALRTGLDWLDRRFPLGSADTVAWTSPLGTDGELREVLWPLLAGVPVVSAGDPASVVFATADALPAPAAGTAPRLVLVTGEALSRAAVDDFLDRAPAHLTLYQLATPPEVAVALAAGRCVSGADAPYAWCDRDTNGPLWVVDEHGERTPFGLIGRAVRPGPDADVVLAERVRRTADGALHPVPTIRGVAWSAGHRFDPSLLEAQLRGEEPGADCVLTVRRGPAGNAEHVALVCGSVDERRWRERARAVLPAAVPVPAVLPVTALPIAADGTPDPTAASRWPVLDRVTAATACALADPLPGVVEATVLTEDVDVVVDRLHVGRGPVRPGGPPTRSAPEPGTASGDPQAPPSVSEGPELGELPYRTLREALDHAAASGTGGLVFVGDGPDRRRGYAELAASADRIAAGLRLRGAAVGDLVVLQCEDPADFTQALWGCLAAGCVAVPLAVPPVAGPAHAAAARVRAAREALGDPWVLVAGRAAADGSAQPADPRVLSLAELRTSAADGRTHRAASEDVALLLLTSGSTGVPKAVALSHRNVLSRCAATARANHFDEHDVSFNWMPLDHVGGVVMFHLRDVFLGTLQVHAPTPWVLADPLRWLTEIDRHRARVTWAPNFAYGLVNERVAELTADSVDLSCLRFVLNAGEAVTASTARRFLSLLAPFGLVDTAMHPAWGMSETSSAVVYSDTFAAAGTEDGPVEVGRPIAGIAVRIVDAEQRPVPEGRIGLLQVRGATVTRGYHQAPEHNARAFTADGWFDTGDLGVLRAGALTITGRAKDVIIVNGVNHHGHEIEAHVEELPHVERSFTAACAVREDAAGTDLLALFVCLREDAEPARALREIHASVRERFGVAPSYLIPVDRADVPKTEIGKIQRTRLRERFESGEFAAEIVRADLLLANERTLPAWFHTRRWSPVRAARVADATPRSWLVLARGDADVALCQGLRAAGHRVVSALVGADFRAFGPDRYAVRPEVEADFARLFAALDADGVRPDGVLHLWTLGGGGAADAPSAEDRRLGAVAVLHVARTLVALGERSPVRDLVVVGDRTQGVDESEEPVVERGAILPLLRSTAAQLPTLRCRHVDLPAGAVLSVDAVVTESADPVDEPEIAYRDGRRLAPRLAPASIDRPATTGRGPRRGGHYLVTGGSGGVGTEVCRWLLREYDARLLVVGRSARLPEEHPLAAESAVRYASVDVTDAAALRAEVDRACVARGAPLDGVFHLAGVLDERLIANTTAADLAASGAPKVAGAWALHTVLADRPDALFVAFSSVNAVFGGATTAGYGAANGELDAFVRMRVARGLHAISLGWSMWDETGMSAGYRLKDATRARGFHVLTRSEGLRSLEHALTASASHVLIGVDAAAPAMRGAIESVPAPAARLVAYVRVDPDAAPLSTRTLSLSDRHGRAAACDVVEVPEIPRGADGAVDVPRLVALGRGSGTAGRRRVAPRDDTERTVARLWAEVLGCAEPGVEDNFFESGGHSLVAARIVLRLREVYAVELPLQVLFEQPTVAGLAAAVEHALGRGGAGGSTAGDLAADAVLAPEIRPEAGTEVSAGLVRDPEQVFLTGATGLIGGRILAELLRTTKADVHCLVESGVDPSAALRTTMRDLELPDDPQVSCRVHAVPGRLGEPRLGLSDARFAELAESIDAVWHCGSEVNLASSYERLRAVNVRGTHEILRFAAAGRAKPVHVVSSPAALLDPQAPPAPLREDGRITADRVSASGYARTKWVAEELVHAARERGVRAFVYRPGRVGGTSDTGAGGADTVLWQLVRSYVETGTVPDAPGTELDGLMLDVAPVDHVARVMVELSRRPDGPGEAFHVAGAPMPFARFVDGARALGYRLRSVDAREWAGSLAAEADRLGPDSATAAVALLVGLADDSPGFGSLRLDTSRTDAALAAAGVDGCPGLDPETVERAFRRLVTDGLLPAPPR